MADLCVLRAVCAVDRHWGIPIPALHCQQCGRAQLNEEIVAAVSNGVEKHGIDFWEQVRLAPPPEGA